MKFIVHNLGENNNKNMFKASANKLCAVGLLIFCGLAVLNAAQPGYNSELIKKKVTFK